jgi:hypothetical protein
LTIPSTRQLVLVVDDDATMRLLARATPGRRPARAGRAIDNP